MSQFIFILQIERCTRRGPLTLSSKPFQHSLLQAKRRIIFTKTSIKDAASTSLCLPLLEQDFFSLQFCFSERPCMSFKLRTCSSPACLALAGFPTTPLSFLPPTSCFSRVTFSSNGLRRLWIFSSFAAVFCFSFSTGTDVRFRFFDEGFWPMTPACASALLSCPS
jgi:hypothetical protein